MEFETLFGELRADVRGLGNEVARLREAFEREAHRAPCTDLEIVRAQLRTGYLALTLVAGALAWVVQTLYAKP